MGPVRGGLAIVVVGLVWAGVPAATVLFAGLILACPLMMVTMMRGMHGDDTSSHDGHGTPTHSHQDHDAADQADGLSGTGAGGANTPGRRRS